MRNHTTIAGILGIALVSLCLAAVFPIKQLLLEGPANGGGQVFTNLDLAGSGIASTQKFGAATNAGSTGLVYASAGATNDVLRRNGSWAPESATQADYAVVAGSAGTANHATDAALATNALTANHATDAALATNALTAIHATDAGSASNALFRYASDATAGAEVYVLASGTGVTSVRVGDTITFTVPAGVHLLSARLRWDGTTLGSAATIVLGTADMANSALGDRWNAICQVVREDNGALVAGASCRLDTTSPDTLLIVGLSTATKNHIRLGF